MPERMRPPSQVGEQAKLVAEALALALDEPDLYAPAEIEQLRGSLAALKWMLGDDVETPVSAQRSIAPIPAAVAMECLWAAESLRSVRPLPPQGFQHVNGAFAAMSWAFMQTSQAPVGSPEGSPLRAVDEVERVRQSLRERITAPPPAWIDEDVAEARGAAAALDWILAVSSAPLSGAAPGPSRDAIASESEAAAAASRPSPGVSRESRSYAGGVYDACQWALDLSDRQPIPPF